MEFLRFTSSMTSQKIASWDTGTRPKAPQSTKSFSRFDSTTPSPPRPRSRATTLQGAIPESDFTTAALPPARSDGKSGDIFSTTSDGVVGSPISEAPSPLVGQPETFEELPIEIRSLTERFLESLSAKVHPTPLSVDALSELFQDFYVRADSHIATHIAALSSRLSRGKSPAPSVASVASRASASSRTRTDSPSRKASGDQQMLTASEIISRKKARRLLELKKAALEEAVERMVCERVYDRIWRHRSADDEERDQKLRSRIAALSLVGIGLKELLSGADDIPDEIRQKTVDEQDHIRDLLAGARSNIQDMDKEKCPQGKLQHLTAAHKSIVETLSQLFPASSSADEILPTLIYALITSSPEHVNVISDLKFIQRFRAAGKVDGETAYCLVNLEAASSFLETVDLPSLRADENPEGPEKSERPITPRTQTAPMRLGITPAVDPLGISSSETSPSNRPLPSPVRSQRRLSNLISMQTNRLNEASDAVRGVVLDSADQAFDTINNTLESSFKFLFGRLREHQEQSTSESGQEVILPKTLEDARKLVSTPTPPLEEGDEAAPVSVASSVVDHGGENGTTVDDPLRRPTLGSNDRVSELFAGRRAMRDRSADSTQSGGSGKRVAFETTPVPPTSAPLPAGGGGGGGPNAAVESVRNFGNTINPLNQFARMGGLFGRSNSGNATPTLPPPAAVAAPPVVLHHTAAAEKQAEVAPPSPSSPGRISASTDSRAVTAIEELRKLTPPDKRFVECKDARDLRVGDVEDLLREYQRLVAAMGKAVGP
ncbi:hypothetical protein EJ08DRAFT_736774 [Tothia fuscella]|uniref:VPS9 domain-containing protein n=1 Tax=Tothia fuscella TaxID=1048955 RepID=A0A9P4NK51_9PEZI|nr:hypothetical protein EJ08DRAFT_736774 [Tothia fuscella]